jgi:gliding motility-associated-like protein
MKYKLLFFFILIVTSSLAQNKNKTNGFTENKGQIIDQNGRPNATVKYLLNSRGLNVQLKKNGFSYDVYETKKHPIKHRIADKKAFTSLKNNDKKAPDYTLEYIFHRVDIDFVNANPKVELISNDESKDYDNYYNVPNKPEGVINVHQYQQITYKNIYPNIDVVFSIPKDSLKTVEYNFVVHPKGKISDIQLKFNGAKTELVDNKIKMQVRFGEMEETLPASWTEEGERKKEINVGYTKIRKNVYGFASSENLTNKTVVIDPVPVRLWGTFYGDQTNDFVNIGQVNIATDASGSTYMTGSTRASNSSYATSGAHQTSIPPFIYGSRNGIIVKFSPDGSRMWGTYYGGIKDNIIKDIKIDAQNNVVIAGETQSQTNISTIGTYKPNLEGSGDTYDAFLVKFNDSGIRLWGTYFGGEDHDSAYALDIDINYNIYIVGTTSSETKIAINSSFQTQLSQGNPVYDDGFLAKFDIGGNLVWSTYVGGENHDELKTIKIKDNYLVTGGTSWSYTAIATTGVFQEAHGPSGQPDATIYKFALNGQRIWSTYYGGEHNEDIFTIDVDNEDNIYVGGQTESDNKMTTSGSFESLSQYVFDKGFFAKLNSNGERIWGSYLGTAYVHSIVFKNNSIYIGATTHGNSYKTELTNSCSYIKNAESQGFVGKFSKQGNFIWGTYVGNGYGVYSDTKIALDNNNGIFVSGAAVKNDGIADNLSYQPNLLGSSNYFLMKFSEDINLTSSVIISSNSPVCIGKTLELKASGGTNYSWTGPNGFSSILQNPTIPNATALNSGEYSCLITGTGGCDDTKKVDVIIGDIEAPVPDLAILPTITGDCNTTITTIPTATDACSGAITATTTSPISYSLPGTYTVVWKYDDGNGNSINQNQTVTIASQPLPITTSPQTFCIQQNATFNEIAITGQNIKWYDALTNGNLLLNTTVLLNGINYYASQTINGCESERIAILINIQNTPLPTANANQSFCTGSNPTISNIQVTGNQIKWYDTLTNGSLLAETTNLVDGKTYYASQRVNNCESERFGVNVSIVNTPSAPTANATVSFCKRKNATLSDIQITGQNIKWYDSNFATAVLPNNTLLENNKTYYASQTIGCESNRTAILIQVYNTPLPIANNNQQFCIDENAIISNLKISGSNIKWYDEPTNGSILAESTLLQNNKTYYATQTLNDCESERLPITSTIQDTPPPTAYANQSFCIQKNAKISDITIVGQNINWFESLSTSTSLSESAALENGITYYASQTINGCESQRTPITIQIEEATTIDCINFVDELPYPKFFTPNNDSHNDTWTIDFNYLKINSSIKIFDRYGKFIKELTSTDTSWDGTYNGKELPATDYWFLVTRLNGDEFKSHFSLKR